MGKDHECGSDLVSRYHKNSQRRVKAEGLWTAPLSAVLKHWAAEADAPPNQGGAVWLRFERTSDGVAIANTEEVAPGVMIDLDADGQMVGIEVLSVSIRGNGAYGKAPVRSAAAE